MLALGNQYGEGPVLIATLAKEESIPPKFLEVILLKLKGHGLLASKSGKRWRLRARETSVDDYHGVPDSR